MQILDYKAVKQVACREHQASNILLMERRYESVLLRPPTADVRRFLSPQAYTILANQYPDFEDIHTRHNINQIHNILHNEILLFKQDANAIMHEMFEIK